MVRALPASLLFATFLTAVRAQEGTGVTGPTSSPDAAGYSCDATVCKLPSCHCASTSPPGGLTPAQTPQFITFTADDAIQSYTTEVVNHFLASRKNPNGCAPKMTYFNSLAYNNYSMVTDWYVAGNEIADHTMTHVGSPNSSEILGNLKALNAYSGIPVSEISGFRAPLLNFTANTLTQLHAAGFRYDSSATAASPANATDTDAFWPYTLDYGMANNCLGVTGICRGQLKLPGLWEIPMYAIFETVNSVTPIHLMDPWLDTTDQAALVNWLKNSFLSHYDGNRQPFGLYTHPIHLAVGYPGVADPLTQRAAVNEFLDWVQTFDDVWFVTNQQLLDWVQNPVPISSLSSFAPLGCSTPNIPATQKICNGIPANEQGLLLNCPFPEFPFTTCYGCPVTPPTPDNPVPAQNTAIGVRTPISANCSTPFWDPVAGNCICTDATCQFTDNTGAIQNPTGVAGSVSASRSATGAAASASASSRPQSSASKTLVGGVLGALAGVLGLAVAFA